MWKSGDLLHRPVDKLLCLPFDGGGNIVDASDCRNDPDAVADPDFSVFPAVALKITGIFRSKGRRLRIVSIGEKFTEPGFKVVRMDPGACRAVFLKRSDRTAVFDYGCSGFQRKKCEFVSLRNFFLSRNAAAECDLLPAGVGESATATLSFGWIWINSFISVPFLS